MRTLEERVPLLGGVRDGRDDHMHHLAIEQAPRHTASDGGSGQTPFAWQGQGMPSRRESPCDIVCKCSCHHVASYSWSSMRPLQSLVGFLVVAYTRWVSGCCTNPGCRAMGQGRRVVRDMYLTYHLPGWLARSSILAFYSNSLCGSPQLMLRYHYRRDWGEFGVLSLVRTGDVDGVKSCIRNGILSIHDLWSEYRFFILHLAFLMDIDRGGGDFGITNVLLQAGADPFQRDNDAQGRCLASMVFRRSLSRPDSCAELTGSISLQRYVEEAEFTPLHLAVVGVLQLDLASMVESPDCAGGIEAKTADGLTPLHLAAIRGDEQAAKLLIRAGADPDSQTFRGETPLALAAAYNHVEVARVLLDAGACPSRPCHNNNRPIQIAALISDQDSTGVLSLLLQHGEDVNSHEDRQDWYAPLACAISRGTIHAVRFLLERGADPNTGDNLGAAPLFDAIAVPRVGAALAKTKLLLQYGADMTVVFPVTGDNVLHSLAHKGDVELIKLFTGREFRGRVNTALVNGEGKTPLDYLNDRASPPSPELRGAFDRLLESVERQNSINMSLAEDADGSGSDGEMEFFDAEDVDGVNNGDA